MASRCVVCEKPLTENHKCRPGALPRGTRNGLGWRDASFDTRLAVGTLASRIDDLRRKGVNEYSHGCNTHTGTEVARLVEILPPAPPGVAERGPFTFVMKPRWRTKAIRRGAAA